MSIVAVCRHLPPWRSRTLVLVGFAVAIGAMLPRPPRASPPAPPPAPVAAPAPSATTRTIAVPVPMPVAIPTFVTAPAACPSPPTTAERAIGARFGGFSAEWDAEMCPPAFGLEAGPVSRVAVSSHVGVLAVATGDGAVWLSRDDGRHFARVLDERPGELGGLAIDCHGRLFVSRGGWLGVLDADGPHWRAHAGVIEGLAAHGAWLTRRSGASVLVSGDAGATWSYLAPATAAWWHAALDASGAPAEDGVTYEASIDGWRFETPEGPTGSPYVTRLIAQRGVETRDLGVPVPRADYSGFFRHGGRVLFQNGGGALWELTAGGARRRGSWPTPLQIDAIDARGRPLAVFEGRLIRRSFRHGWRLLYGPSLAPAYDGWIVR